MKKTAKKLLTRKKRQSRIRSRVEGTKEIPRLAVFKSNRYMYAQIINDETGEVLASVDSRDIGGTSSMQKAEKMGKDLVSKFKGKKVVFDRGGFVYTGKVKAIADGARSAGLEF